ncbi:MAG: holo-[acyl-carrier-protein] synthase [Desulfovibrio sp.]|uniref:holo-[acyl-carrier-protein] synthase n=1 Tax=Desulfovibrio sp. 7SRBS1 TaxID=3378064 RepID=UPI003B3F8369
MIVGLGVDLTEINRVERSIERFGQRFIDRVLGPSEQNGLPRKRLAEYVAARFAAKEAAVKALGTGFAEGIGFHDLQVTRNSAGKPGMIFHGPALEHMQAMGGQRILLTLTHAKDMAAAVVIIES